MNLLLGVEFSGVEEKAARRRDDAHRPCGISAQDPFSQKKLLGERFSGPRAFPALEKTRRSGGAGPDAA
jgi:hypothetical protein